MIGHVTAPEQERIASLVQIVSERHEVSREDIMGRSRLSRFVEPRQVVWTVLRRAGWRFVDIGGAFGRDHSTVFAGVEKIERRAKCDEETAEELMEVQFAWNPMVRGTYLEHLRARVKAVREVAREGREYLMSVEREADTLMRKIERYQTEAGV